MNTVLHAPSRVCWEKLWLMGVKVKVTNLQVEDKLWDDILLHESNGTSTPSGTSKPSPEGTIITRNLDKLFQFRTAEIIRGIISKKARFRNVNVDRGVVG